MTESSWYWAGTTTGDAGTYTDDEFSDLWRYLFLQDRTLQGVIRGILNDLEVTGTTSPVSVDTGVALVDGKAYRNSAATTVVIPTPSTSTRIDLIVLEKDFTAQTVRIARVAGTEGAGAPALTQADGTTWQIKLAEVSITTGGIITVTDARAFAWSPLSYLFWLLGADSLITAKGQILAAKAADSLGVVPAAGGDGYPLVSDSSQTTGLNYDNPIRYVELEPYSFKNVETCVVADGVAFVRVPADLDGYDLVSVAGDVQAAGTTGTMTAQVRNATTGHDLLSTKLTFASGATQDNGSVAINGTYKGVSAGDRIFIDVDSLHTTPATGLAVTLGFQLP